MYNKFPNSADKLFKKYKYNVNNREKAEKYFMFNKNDDGFMISHPFI
jgi:hypothetical protein